MIKVERVQVLSLFLADYGEKNSEYILKASKYQKVILSFDDPFPLPVKRWKDGNRPNRLVQIPIPDGPGVE